MTGSRRSVCALFQVKVNARLNSRQNKNQDYHLCCTVRGIKEVSKTYDLNNNLKKSVVMSHTKFFFSDLIQSEFPNLERIHKKQKTIQND